MCFVCNVLSKRNLPIIHTKHLLIVPHQPIIQPLHPSNPPANNATPHQRHYHPTQIPSITPTNNPTIFPTKNPTNNPTYIPTQSTTIPCITPSISPSYTATEFTTIPTNTRTIIPSNATSDPMIPIACASINQMIINNECKKGIKKLKMQYLRISIATEIILYYSNKGNSNIKTNDIIRCNAANIKYLHVSSETNFIIKCNNNSECSVHISTWNHKCPSSSHSFSSSCLFFSSNITWRVESSEDESYDGYDNKCYAIQTMVSMNYNIKYLYEIMQCGLLDDIIDDIIVSIKPNTFNIKGIDEDINEFEYGIVDVNILHIVACGILNVNERQSACSNSNGLAYLSFDFDANEYLHSYSHLRVSHSKNDEFNNELMSVDFAYGGEERAEIVQVSDNKGQKSTLCVFNNVLHHITVHYNIFDWIMMVIWMDMRYNSYAILYLFNGVCNWNIHFEHMDEYIGCKYNFIYCNQACDGRIKMLN